MLTDDLRTSAHTRIPLLDLTSMSREIAPVLDLVWADLTETSAFIGGGYVERFEQEWADYCGTRHAIGLANGTDALELALRALGIGPGDEVLIPTNGFVAAAEAVVLAGAIPRFIDVDPDTLLLTAEGVEEALGDRTAAVIAVHLYGGMPNMDRLQAVCDRAGIVLIEDAAQAQGARWRGRPAGSFGAVGCFSFYPGKNLGAFGDAGALVTNDDGLAAKVRSLANHGRPAGAAHIHSVVARNSRLDALQAGVLSAKLTMLDRWNERRREIVDRYRSGLSGSGLRMLEIEPDCRSVFHQVVVRVPDRDRVRAHLAEEQIETGIHYPVPCHLQEPYREYAPGPLPVAERAAEEILSLPLFPHLTEVQIDRVVRALEEALGRAGGTDD
jgi:dTDP-4-amino-4,6-dideoxygalactose transaminase